MGVSQNFPCHVLPQPKNGPQDFQDQCLAFQFLSVSHSLPSNQTSYGAAFSTLWHFNLPDWWWTSMKLSWWLQPTLVPHLCVLMPLNAEQFGIYLFHSCSASCLPGRVKGLYHESCTILCPSCDRCLIAICFWINCLIMISTHEGEMDNILAYFIFSYHQPSFCGFMLDSGPLPSHGHCKTLDSGIRNNGTQTLTCCRSWNMFFNHPKLPYLFKITI